MGAYLYFGAVIFIILVAFCSFKLGDYCLDSALSRVCIVLLITVSILLYYSSVNAIDSSNYETRFLLVDNLSITVDVFFTEFIKFVKLFTDDYQVFRGIIGAISLVPMLFLLKEKSASEMNKPLFILLCLLYPFFQSIVALRFTMASSIAVLALYLYFKSRQTKLGVFMTAIALVISASIHDSSILYLVLFGFFIVYKKGRKKRNVFIMLLGADFILIILLRMGWILNIVNALMGETNSFYLEIMQGAGIGFLIPAFLHLVFVFTFNRTISGEISTGHSDEVDLDIMTLNYCSLILIPLYSINVLSFRVFRGMLLLDFFVISRHYYDKKKNLTILVVIILEVTCMLFDASGIQSLLSILGGGIGLEWIVTTTGRRNEYNLGIHHLVPSACQEVAV